MNEYTLTEFLDDLHQRHSQDGKPLIVAPARPQRTKTLEYATRHDTIVIQDRLNPWNGEAHGSGALDRFDIRSGTHTAHAWWIPGHTRNQHEVYQTMRADGMKPSEAQNVLEAIEL